MIQAEVTLLAIAETEAQIHALLERLVEPAKGVTIRADVVRYVEFPNAR